VSVAAYPPPKQPEPGFTDHSAEPDTADTAWRAEVASRVNSYQARRKRRHAGENSPALDFGPADGAQSFGTPSPRPAGNALRDVVRNAAARNAARNAIDTNYYRRLNAESMAQGVSGAATAPAQQFEADFESMNETAVEAESQSAREPRTHYDAAAEDPALDLETGPAAAEPSPTVAPGDSFLERYSISEPAPEPPAPPVQEKPVQGNLIVFPRPFMEPPLLPQPSRDELAEPMNHRPRILEVPEDIMPVVQGSLFPEIRLDADEEEGASHREPEFEVPLRVASAAGRLVAGLIDWGVVIAASLLFAGMAWRALPGIPHAKPFWMTLGAVTLLLWAVYQHMFLLYAGCTLGMRMRGIRLSTFDGQPPQWQQRRRRARFMVISFAAVSLGFLWALADEDALCWHDRISRTFPTADE
jgi:uncharacterized RDD family membrane protein YckC